MSRPHRRFCSRVLAMPACASTGRHARAHFRPRLPARRVPPQRQSQKRPGSAPSARRLRHRRHRSLAARGAVPKWRQRSGRIRLQRVHLVRLRTTRRRACRGRSPNSSASGDRVDPIDLAAGRPGVLRHRSAAGAATRRDLDRRRRVRARAQLGGAGAGRAAGFAATGRRASSERRRVS